MSTLHGEPVYPGDKVYDTIDGWGTVESVTAACLWVNIGQRTKRRYTRDGFVSSRNTPTLEWHRPPRVRFSKNTQGAEAQRKFLEGAVALMNTMHGDCSCSCVELVELPETGDPCAPCGECNGCG